MAIMLSGRAGTSVVSFSTNAARSSCASGLKRRSKPIVVLGRPHMPLPHGPSKWPGKTATQSGSASSRVDALVLLRRVAAAEVRPPDIAHQQRVAGQHHRWLRAARRIDDQQRDQLWAVAGRVRDAQANLPQRQLLAVMQWAEGIAHARRLVQAERGAMRLGQCARAGDVVGVDVGVDDVAQRKVARAQQVVILLDLAWKDRRSPPRASGARRSGRRRSHAADREFAESTWLAPLFCARNVAGRDQDIIVWLTGKAACSIPCQPLHVPTRPPLQARSRGCPTRSTSRRSCAHRRNRAAREARPMCALNVRRCDNRR